MEENEKCQQEDGRAEKKKRELPQQEVDSSRKKPKLVQECHSEVKKRELKLSGMAIRQKNLQILDSVTIIFELFKKNIDII